MPISVSCQGCGRAFRAPDGLAGKRVKCPKCAAAIEVGEPTPPSTARATRPEGHADNDAELDAAISVACACGKAFRAKAALAGKRVKCPACGQTLAIPGPAAAADSQATAGHAAPSPAGNDAPAAMMDFDAMMAADGATLPDAPLGPPGRPGNLPGRPRKKAGGLPTRLIVGLGIGGGVAALVLVGVMLLWPGGDDAELAGSQTVPGAMPASDTQPPDASSTPPPPTTPGASPPPPAPPGERVADVERTYPSLPGAVTEPPDWLGDDVPFDVAAYFAAPPPERNAAPLYLDALLEFSDEMAACFCPIGEEPQGEIKRRAEAAAARAAKWQQFEEAWQNDPASVDFAQVDAWLAGYETGFKKLAAAQKRPECVFEGGMGLAGFFGHVIAGREASRVVVWRTRRGLTRRDCEQSLRDIETTLRLSRDIQPRGDLLGQLGSISMDAMCLQDVMQPLIRSDAFAERHCNRLLAVLGEHEAVSRRRFVKAVEGEYISFRKAFLDLQHRSGDLSPQALKEYELDGPIDSPRTTMAFLLNLGIAGGGGVHVAQEKYGVHLEHLPLDHPLNVGWAIDGKLMSDDAYAREVDAVNRIYTVILDSANQTILQRYLLSQDSTVLAPLRDTKLAFFFEPRWDITVLALLRAETILHGTQCLIAVRRWQLEHGGPPPDLATAVEAAGMAAVPIDPYSDRPMRMTLIDGQPVVYSVGLDGKDDGGLVEWDLIPENPHGDVLFPLPAGR